MKLLELLLSPLPWSWDGDITSGSYASATFNTGKKQYELSIGGIGSPVADVQFRSEDGQSITGSGDAFAVFSTILDILRDFVTKRKPRGFGFSAHGTHASRIKLYDRLCSVLAKDLPNYELRRKDYRTEVHYFFKRVA